MSFAEAQALARRVAELASGRLGEPLWLRDYPVTVHGEIGRVVIGLSRGALHRAIAIISDLGSVRVAAVDVWTPDGPALRGVAAGGPDDDAPLAETIAEAIRGRPEAWPIGLLDAGYGLYDAIGQKLAVPGSHWRLSTWGEWDARQSGLSVELAGGPHEWTDLISVRPAATGVAISIPSGRMRGTGTTRTIETMGGLVDALGDIVEDVRAAVDGRATFRARPDSLAVIARLLVDAIRSDRALLGTLRVTTLPGSGFPHAWPAATIDRVDDLGPHPYVQLAESAAGVTITIDTPRGPYATVAAVTADLPVILDEVRAASDRLRPDRLIPGRAYRVIARIAAAGVTIEPGARLIYTGRQEIPRDGFAIYRFAAGDPAGGGLELVDYADADLAILRRLHEVLAEADPA